MTPIDPAFLLIPFLRILLSDVRPALFSFTSPDKTLQKPQYPFKPTDDLIEEAIAKHTHPEDAATFLGLDCARNALRQLCDTKGTS
jgi:hypothetical protein